MRALDLRALEAFLRTRKLQLRVRWERGNWNVVMWRGPKAGYGRNPVLTDAIGEAMSYAKQFISPLPTEEP